MNGHLGWVRHGTHEGDEIYIAYSRSLPLTLRKITSDGDDENTSDANPSLKLVGTAYNGRAMDGQMMNHAIL